ncbi:ABC transporter permease [Desulfurivibrio sp. D14AmB]|uniref:ABC transporter permease n=1 Tax=Desulfurivibrio sp. D14AmB TaxID=3374370 RepID=UPI00376EF179
MTKPTPKFSLPELPGERFFGPGLAVLLFLLLWEAAARLYANEYLLPGPYLVLLGLVEVWGSGLLPEHIVVSLFRFGVAYLLAVLLAVPLGLILGWFTRLHRALDPLIQLLRPISPVAWFPLAVLWFRIGDLPAIFIIFIASFFPILLSTIAAVRSVDPTYIKVALNFGSSQASLLCKVVIPAAFPYIAVGLHIALGVGWIHLVAGEMLGAQSGLGYFILDARNFLRTDLVIVGMLLVGALGLLLDRLMAAAEKKVRRRWGITG